MTSMSCVQQCGQQTQSALLLLQGRVRCMNVILEWWLCDSQRPCDVSDRDSAESTCEGLCFGMGRLISIGDDLLLAI